MNANAETRDKNWPHTPGLSKRARCQMGHEGGAAGSIFFCFIHIDRPASCFRSESCLYLSKCTLVKCPREVLSVSLPRNDFQIHAKRTSSIKNNNNNTGYGSSGKCDHTAVHTLLRTTDDLGKSREHTDAKLMTPFFYFLVSCIFSKNGTLPSHLTRK